MWSEMSMRSLRALKKKELIGDIYLPKLDRAHKLFEISQLLRKNPNKYRERYVAISNRILSEKGIYLTDPAYIQPFPQY
jgi:hypothetical protein